jgi:hypothetical protein
MRKCLSTTNIIIYERLAYKSQWHTFISVVHINTHTTKHGMIMHGQVRGAHALSLSLSLPCLSNSKHTNWLYIIRMGNRLCFVYGPTYIFVCMLCFVRTVCCMVWNMLVIALHQMPGYLIIFARYYLSHSYALK